MGIALVGDQPPKALRSSCAFSRASFTLCLRSEWTVPGLSETQYSERLFRWKNQTIPPEIRERAVQLLIESEKDYPSTWAAITAIAPKIGCTPETLRAWHQKHLDQQNPIKVQQISDQEKMKQMEREIKELKRANEILRKAAAFFAQAELDRPHK